MIIDETFIPKEPSVFTELLCFMFGLLPNKFLGAYYF